jgi:hypothetical protein
VDFSKIGRKADLSRSFLDFVAGVEQCAQIGKKKGAYTPFFEEFGASVQKVDFPFRE